MGFIILELPTLHFNSTNMFVNIIENAPIFIEIIKLILNELLISFHYHLTLNLRIRLLHTLKTDGFCFNEFLNGSQMHKLYS